ncbi:MAG TPA: tRNA (adenosine(37)-N6)-threonylcarbamoyltransferase complex dimerization subunit type 1 TsaB [Candidatus Saccharimonadales bacterium]|nr:tRNA (adenosine(37)-N6)-threonylcarbamoyltransferase complex dimerization subunit type 1 TsaB [Candidatus Saccharimonadales bacterium]
MLILTIRTDKPEAEIGLFNGADKLSYSTWSAHRQLAETIHLKIKELLDSQSCGLKDVESVAVYKGPGSFTGLRIGLSVVNTLADSFNLPIVSETGDEWIAQACGRLQKGENEHIALPEYGAEPHITKQKK